MVEGNRENKGDYIYLVTDNSSIRLAELLTKFRFDTSSSQGEISWRFHFKELEVEGGV